MNKLDPVNIPISSVQKYARAHNLRQVIMLGWDGQDTHIVSYGETIDDCDQAAAGANKVKEFLGWPESLRAEPSRITKVKADLKKILKDLGDE